MSVDPLGFVDNQGPPYPNLSTTVLGRTCNVCAICDCRQASTNSWLVVSNAAVMSSIFVCIQKQIVHYSEKESSRL